MNHVTPHLFATEYKVDFQEDLSHCQAYQKKLLAEIATLKESVTSLANENIKLRAQIGQVKNKFSDSIEGYRGMNDCPHDGVSCNVYYDGSPPPKDFDWKNVESGLKIDEPYNGSRDWA